MTPNETLQYFRQRQPLIVDAIREVVDIESPSHDAVRSREVVDWVVRQANATGVDVTIERISVEDGDHVVIRAFAGEGKHTLVLGHTDTVHPSARICKIRRGSRAIDSTAAEFSI